MLSELGPVQSLNVTGAVLGILLGLRLGPKRQRKGKQVEAPVGGTLDPGVSALCVTLDCPGRVIQNRGEP